MTLGMIGGRLGGAVLLAFYLYLAVRPKYLERPAVYRFGLLGFVVMFIGSMFTYAELSVVAHIVIGLGQLLALFAGVMACTDTFVPAVDEYFTRRAQEVRAEQKRKKESESE